MSKKYKKSTEKLVQSALKMVEEKRQQGWTQKDFANALKNMLESPKGGKVKKVKYDNYGV